MTATISIALQQADFELSREYAALRAQNPHAGAIVTFTGLVREFSPSGDTISGLELSSYAELFDAQAQALAQEVSSRFDIEALTIIHRTGVLKPSEQIVFVGVASKHRNAAFDAANMTMDHLKSKVAFWKKEQRIHDGQRSSAWIYPSARDQDALKHWGD